MISFANSTTDEIIYNIQSEIIGKTLDGFLIYNLYLTLPSNKILNLGLIEDNDLKKTEENLNWWKHNINQILEELFEERQKFDINDTRNYEKNIIVDV